MAEKLVEIAIEGVDGVGKSSVARELGALILPYQVAHICNPYHTARRINGDEDIYPLWSTPVGARKAIDVLKAAILEERDIGIEAGVDMIIYDRHWMTAFTEMGDDPELVKHWGDDFPKTALLVDARPQFQQTIDSNNNGDDWDKPNIREQYKLLYRKLGQQYEQHMLGRYLVGFIPQDFERVALSIDNDLRYRR